MIFEIEFEDGTILYQDAPSGTAAIRSAEIRYARENGKLLTEVGVFGCKEVDCERISHSV